MSRTVSANSPVSGMSLFGLEGRVIIVTGAANGIGLFFSQRLAELGASVVLADIDAEKAAAEAEKLTQAGHSALGVHVDVADESSTREMATKSVAAFGGIDSLVNNAALLHSLPRRGWERISVGEWDRVMAVNCRGPFLCCRAVVPHMTRRTRGTIVNMSSSRVFAGTPRRLHYTTSKAGIVGFTRALARELGPENIRVNAIAPGLTLTAQQIESASADYRARSAAGRALQADQTPDDLLGVLVFLISDASAAMTGQTLSIDGGEVMR